MQIGAVGVVHQQRHPIPVADLCQPGDVGEPAEVVRAGDIHPGIVPAGGKGGLHLGRGHRRREAVRGQVLGEPHRPQVQQGHRLDGGGVGVAAEQELPAQRAHQRQHGLDTQGAAPGGEEGAAGAVEGGAAGLGFGDGAAGLKEAVRPADLGEVPGGHRRQKAAVPAFVPRGVKAAEALPAQPVDGGKKWCAQASVPPERFSLDYTRGGGAGQAGPARAFTKISFDLE